MFMNRKSDYALRIIRALADGKRHTANSLATNEQIPLAFAYKILKKLSNAGLVRLDRGLGGGCSLEKICTTFHYMTLSLSWKEMVILLTA